MGPASSTGQIAGAFGSPGKDRRDYLQGLLTNDIVALSAGSGCYACLLTAQGRMIADMYVVETGEAILIDLEGHLAARVGAHLEQFVFSEDVEVADVSGSVAQLGVFGPLAAAVIERVLGSQVIGADRRSRAVCVFSTTARGRGTGRR